MTAIKACAMLFKNLSIEGPIILGSVNALKASWVDTPLGSMLAIADEQALYLVEFADRGGLEKEIARLTKRSNLPIVPGKTDPISQIEHELENYFSDKIQDFRTSLFLLGSPFQKRVWEELQKIPRGQTRSYADIAKAIGKPSAFRAVALANSANPFAIVIPCHRVINSNGDLGGYSGGIKRKAWLLEHERKGEERSLFSCDHASFSQKRGC